MARKTPPVSGSSAEDRQLDLVTKYFLRRLAIAHRQGAYKTRRGEYEDAMMEVILLLLGLPIVGLLGAAVILSLRWLSPSEAAARPLPSKYMIILVTWGLCILIGKFWLGRRLKKYMDDPASRTMLDTERDQRIAERQKTIVIVTFVFVIPAVALLITLWGRI